MSSSPRPARPPAIIIGHGDFAAGLVSAVESITGMGDLFLAMSNTGLSSADVLARLHETVQAHGVRVIFTDLPAGSCNIAAARLAGGDSDVTVVTGVSLPVLLNFALHGDVTGRVAAEQAVERSRTALSVLARVPRGN